MDNRALNQFLDDLAAGRGAGAGEGLDRGLAETMLELRSLAKASLPEASKQRVDRLVEPALSRLAGGERKDPPMNQSPWTNVLPRGVGSNGYAAAYGKPASASPAPRSVRRIPRMAAWFAMAALLAFAAGFGYIVFGPPRAEPEPPAIPAVVAPPATPAGSPVEFLWESSGDPNLPLGNPSHVAVAPDGAIWVADGDHSRFQIFSPDGRFLETWGTSGSGEGKFNFATIGWGGADQGAIAFAPDGSFYVADAGNHRVQKFGPDRRFLTAWGSEGRGPGQFDTPIDLVVDQHGRVYVLDSFRNDERAKPGTGAVQVFDADGQFLAEWGELGSEPGQLSGPFGIGIDFDGTLLIADFDNDRVQRFTPEGEFLDGWGVTGSTEGKFVYAMDAAVDAEGHVFVTDYGNHRVQVFDRDGRFLAEWGEYGTEAGEFRSALGVALGADGTVYVTDAGKRLQAFRMLTSVAQAATPDDATEQQFDMTLSEPVLPASTIYSWSTLYSIEPGLSVEYPGFEIESPVAAVVWVQSGTLALAGNHGAVHRGPMTLAEGTPAPGELLLGPGGAVALELGPDHSYQLRSAGSEPLVFAEFWLIAGPGPLYIGQPELDVLDYYHDASAVTLTAASTATMHLTRTTLAMDDTLQPPEGSFQNVLAEDHISIIRMLPDGVASNIVQNDLVTVVVMTADFEPVAGPSSAATPTSVASESTPSP